MKPFLIISVVCLLACSNELKIERLDGSSITTSNLTSNIQSLVDTADVAGIAISIFNDNELVYKRAFGYANTKTMDSLKTEMVFYGASFSKAVFGFLVAQLANEGVIDLDKPLQDYLEKPLPEFIFEKEWRGFAALKDDKRYEQITARMCLSHTTGFPNWRWMTRDNDFYPEGKIRFFFNPGSRYYYSGEGMALLQFVIENITGKGLEELAQERIFIPLDMQMTSYVWEERFENRYCHGHTTTNEVIPKDIEDEANAAGSMETTPDDYSEFIREVLKLSSEKSPITDLLFAPNIRIHSKRQFGFRAWEDTTENDNIELSYGLGWGLLKSPHGKGAFKEGHGEGFQHYSIVFPDKKMGVIILSNSDNAEGIFKDLLEITIGDTYTPWRWENYIPYNYDNQLSND